MSTMPPLAAATTGRPAAMASSTTVGHGSGQTEGTTTARAERNSSTTRWCGSAPVCRTPLGSSHSVSGTERPASTSSGAPDSIR
jgi:hypothetical protein